MPKALDLIPNTAKKKKKGFVVVQEIRFDQDKGLL
jgi:hypothetical protein